jgi:DNA polymerase III delta prime subunit
MILAGTAGLGKTTVARAMCNMLDLDYIIINGSDESGIETLRVKIRQFASSVSLHSKGPKVIILDEADYLQKNSTQPALRAFIEEFSNNCRFIFTCNYVERIIDALQSRLTSFHLTVADIKIVAKHLVNILDAENVEYDTHDVVNVIKKTYPDIRRALNLLQGSSIGGKLIIKNVTSSNYIEQIIDEVKSKKKASFNVIRQIIADNNINDFTGVYKELHNTYSTPEATIIIEEYLFHSTTISDKEICFMACISKLLNI